VPVVIAGKSGHWYTKDGESRHTLIGANGNKRKTTLRDARKEGLLPSVTTVMDIMRKGALEDWKLEKVVRIAMALPRRDKETDDQFAQRVFDEFEAEGEATREFGSLVHSAAEYLCLNGGRLPSPMSASAAEFAPVKAWVDRIKEWYDANVDEVLGAETVVINELVGYAGRFDLWIKHRVHGESVVDFKTQGVKNSKPRFYEEWCSQLAAYDAGLPQRKAARSLVSVVIDSTAPNPLIEKAWGPMDILENHQIFLRAHALWCAVKGYNPAAGVAS
jgi:hypothetical protein